MNFCDSCKWWDFSYDAGNEKFGICTHTDVPEKLSVAEGEEMLEPTLFTASTFGCIYHQKDGKYLGVVNINDAIKKKK